MDKYLNSLFKSYDKRLITENIDADYRSDEWDICKQTNKLKKAYRFNNHDELLYFLNKILNYEKYKQHNAKIIIDELTVIFNLCTRGINQITELDYEYATECDKIFDEVFF